MYIIDCMILVCTLNNVHVNYEVLIFFLQGLKVIDLQQSDYMRTLESAIQFGLPVVLQNVQEKLDPSLDPVLNKSLMRIGELWGMAMGDIFLL